MDNTFNIMMLAIVAAFCAPFLHAIRSKDWLAILGVSGLLLAAGMTLFNGKTVIHEVLAAVLWLAAYLGAVLADYLAPLLAIARDARQTAENAVRTVDHLHDLSRAAGVEPEPGKRPMSSFFKNL